MPVGSTLGRRSTRVRRTRPSGADAGAPGVDARPNHAPVIVGLPATLSIDEDAPEQTLQFTATDAEDGDAIVFGVVAAADAAAMTNVNVTLSVSSGAKVLTLHFMPTPDWNGATDVVVTATDAYAARRRSRSR
jgi:hypothetical protein